MPPSDGGAPNGAAPITELSEQQAVEAFEGLLDAEERPRRSRAPAPAAQQESDAEPDLGEAPDDAGPEEAPSDDEETDADPDDAQEDDQAEPSAEPPRGWSKEEKALFEQLPAEAQAVIARREAERDKAFSQKVQEVTDHRRALETTFVEIQTERQRYEENLQQLLFVASPEAQQFAQIDWTRLAQEQPAEYVRLSAERDALRGRIGGIQQEIQRVQQQAQYAQAHQFASLRQEQAQELVRALPDFADPEKGPRKATEMRSWLNKRGFSDAEISQVIDHRVLLVVDAAMQADRAQAARRQAETKRSAAAPAVQPPGAGRQRPDSQAARQRAQKMERLRRSGSPDDAISILMDII